MISCNQTLKGDGAGSTALAANKAGKSCALWLFLRGRIPIVSDGQGFTVKSSALILVFFPIFSMACGTAAESIRRTEFAGSYAISTVATEKIPPSKLELQTDGRAMASGPAFDSLNRDCGTIYWSPETAEMISLGCTNLNANIRFSGKDTLAMETGGSEKVSYRYLKRSVESGIQTAAQADMGTKAPPTDNLADMTKADEAIYRPIGELNAQKARDYIKRHNILQRLKTDQYRQIALARIKGAEADDLEDARKKKVGGIPTAGKLGGGFRGYPWGTSMQVIREKHQGLITHDEGNTIKVQVDALEYRFYFYEDFLASVEIVPSDIAEHTNVFDQLRRSYGKPTVKKQHRDRSSNRRGDQFAWKRHEVVWDDGTTAISIQHCETEYDPLNAGCMINPEFSSIISYDSKKLTKLLMDKLGKERRANAPF